MKTMQINAREFACAVEARQYASQFDGRAIILQSGYYVVSETTASLLEEKGVEFAYICKLAGTDRIVTVPVN